VVGRAGETGLIDVHVEDLRIFTKDRHRTVDDRPFGGGEGMVLKPEPLFEAAESLLGDGMNSGKAGDRGEVSADSEIVGAGHAAPLQDAATPISSQRSDTNQAVV